jgi:hypothetical protein
MKFKEKYEFKTTHKSHWKLLKQSVLPIAENNRLDKTERKMAVQPKIKKRETAGNVKVSFLTL